MWRELHGHDDYDDQDDDDDHHVNNDVRLKSLEWRINV
jgi:hypothetical protein